MKRVMFIAVLALAAAIGACESDKGSGSADAVGTGGGGTGGGGTGGGGTGGGGTGGGGTGGGGTGGGGGGAALATDCPARCGAAASACGLPASMCDQYCPTLTEPQLVCIEGAGCDLTALQKCATTTSSGGGSRGGGSPGGDKDAGAGTGSPGGGGSPGGDKDAGPGTAEPCFGLGAGCIYDEFFSESCASLDPNRPYYLACCEATPDESKDCVQDPGGGYCCASK